MGIQDTFAINVRRYRKERGITQEELAEKSGLHRTYIGGIEQNRVNVSLKNVGKIADALEIDPAFLFMREKSASEGTRRAPEKTAAARLSETEHALCSWTDEGVVIQPIDLQDEDLTVHILCTLIRQGFEGEQLMTELKRAQSVLIGHFDRINNQSR